MTADRWARITGIFRSALEKPTAERAAFLKKACAGDETLRRDVERLLAAEAEPTLPSPAAELLETAALELVPGQTLAQYRVEAKIGEGGMGAVYRGYDTRLRRNVALKLLPPERFADLDRKRRLLREARAASALSHPNIVTVYEIGAQGDVDFIAMEYVQGKTLDELIPAKGLPPKKVFRYAVQIADALAKAHASGILHRDLKPSNIMVTEEDRIKVLDFGLAKMLEPSDGSLDTPVVTEEGAIVGTAAYMSPEQAEGRKLDARSDVFSFGSVLYEMATGRRPFLADSRIALLGRIVNEDPQPPGQIAPLPPDLEKLILRCLRKETSRRYQTMADLKAALTDLETETAGPQTSPARKLQPRISLRKVAPFAAVISAAVALTWISARWFQHLPEVGPKRTVKFTFTPSQLLRGGNQEIDAEVSISPDGKHIAYVESQGGQLWIRDIDQEQARPVPGATSVYQVFWSPDDQYVGYSAGTCRAFIPGCNLVRIPVQGGTPVTIVTLQGGFRRAYWSSDGETILYAEWPHGLFTIPSRGGSPTRVLEHEHLEHPSFLDLPDGRRAYLYQAEDRNRPGGHGIYVQLEGDPQRRFIAMSSSSNPYPAYSPTGHIIYVDGSNDAPVIWALPFSRQAAADGQSLPDCPARLFASGFAYRHAGL
jgi:eukaryotic-like serine/threonine-protein kinase